MPDQDIAFYYQRTKLVEDAGKVIVPPITLQLRATISFIVDQADGLLVSKCIHQKPT